MLIALRYAEKEDWISDYDDDEAKDDDAIDVDDADYDDGDDDNLAHLKRRLDLS